ncbi:hypothetical protein FOZ63_007612 [Perkinsus olseni]|uniref:Uncharacterized protein n=1 Tax=Perkinsus olseni TaxID=32597 RepID=A0A7J6QMK5_PEROL|nr:hypothetical protein FOZ63_007612 [Perkinsus olseni]
MTTATTTTIMMSATTPTFVTRATASTIMTTATAPTAMTTVTTLSITSTATLQVSACENQSYPLAKVEYWNARRHVFETSITYLVVSECFRELIIPRRQC